ncbi:MAG: hypothetical protein AAF799_48320 [Myxococcota bacterium]
MKNLLAALALVLFAFHGVVATANATPENEMVVVILELDQGDDEEETQALFTTRLAMENIAQFMELEPVAPFMETGVYVLELESEEQMQLVLRLFDEEGYEVVPNLERRVHYGVSSDAGRG